MPNEEQVPRPELGPMLKAARLRRKGWTVDHVQVALGFFSAREGEPPGVMSRTKLNRIEAGQRALSIEECWRFIEIYPELDAKQLLRAANAVDDEASDEFWTMIETEAARRREAYAKGGNRRRDERAIKVVRDAGEVAVASVAQQAGSTTGTLTITALARQAA